MYKIEFSNEAYEDLDKISEYLFRWDFDLTILDNVKNEISRKLSRNPQANLRLPDGIYKIQILRKNVVYYEIDGGTVRVLNVRAGKMNSRV